MTKSPVILCLKIKEIKEFQTRRRGSMNKYCCLVLIMKVHCSPNAS